MESSRVFVRGLPPTINEAGFRSHFQSSGGNITDIKLIPERRIGFVGYGSPEEAQKAVKYFNRTFIRMSKIAVELAKPIGDASLANPHGRRAVIAPSKPTAPAQTTLQSADKVDAVDNAKKRKREAVDESDPKLKEFLKVMQPSGRSIHDTDFQVTEERPAKIKAVAVPENESDDEYEHVPAKRKLAAPQVRNEDKLATALPVVSSTAPAAKAEAQDEQHGDADGDAGMTEVPSTAPVASATDDDWLRTRTNRLLDLVDDPDEMLLQPSKTSQSAVAGAPPVQPPSAVVVDATDTEAVVPPVAQPEQEPTEDLATVRAPDDDDLERIRKTGRLFVRNLPYTATADALRIHFEQWGDVEEVHVPTPRMDDSQNKGFAFVSYFDADSAVNAFQNPSAFFQGRLIQVLPGSAKRDHNLSEYELSKLPLKQQKLIQKRAEAATKTFQWNSLFMSQDAVADSMSKKLGISKAELLDPHSSESAVKQAIAETSVILDTKTYFRKHGVNLEAFKYKTRGDTSILVKNFPHGTTVSELRTLFEEHGQVLKVLMPPAGTIAIVQFAQAPPAKSAYAKLAHRRFKSSVLLLEKAPKDLFVDDGQETSQDPVSAPAGEDAAAAGVSKLSVSELLSRESDEPAAETGTLYVTNLHFDTTTEDLSALCRQFEGFRSALVKTKTDPKKPGQVLSMGFGFVYFRDKKDVQAALSTLNGYVLQGHKLVVKPSHRGQDAAEERRKEDKARKAVGHRTKLVVKNLPFEATKKDIRSLFSTYGQLRSVRLPKKFGQVATRGFAFVEFTTPREAENAFESLQDTHLLARKLVIQYAEAEAVDAEEEIAKMQKKVGRQANKVALQQLTGAGRKRVTIGGDGDEDDGEM